MNFKKKLLEILKEYKEIFLVYLLILFFIYLFYLYVSLDIESQKLKILQDKNFFPKVEIKTS
jgi:hypothetical protein